MVPFRTFRGPLFPKPVTGQELFFAVSYRKPALVEFHTNGIQIREDWVYILNLDFLMKTLPELAWVSKRHKSITEF